MVNHKLMWRAAVFVGAVMGGLWALAPLQLQAASLEGPARVIDGDTIDLNGTRIRLFGIDAPEHNQTCTDSKGRKWACGTFATQTLTALAAGRLRCEKRDLDRYGRIVARCLSNGRDINAQMVERGAAFAYRKYSTDYVALEVRAEKRGVGLWSGEAERPEAFRHSAPSPRAAPREQASPIPAAITGSGCAIKGNISKSGHVYHMPGQKFYNKTAISPARGERWFCSEAEAQSAGWRAAKR